MNIRLKALGSKLAVCGSLLGCIAIIALYQPSRGQNSGNAASISSDGSADDRYATTLVKRDDIATMAMIKWRSDIPDLQKKISVHVTGADIGSTIAVLAKTTGLNFVCLASSRQSRLTLQLTDMPVWQVMQAVADASGGSWRHGQGLFTLSVAPESRTILIPRALPVPA